MFKFSNFFLNSSLIFIEIALDWIRFKIGSSYAMIYVVL